MFECEQLYRYRFTFTYQAKATEPSNRRRVRLHASVEAWMWSVAQTFGLDARVEEFEAFARPRVKLLFATAVSLTLADYLTSALMTRYSLGTEMNGVLYNLVANPDEAGALLFVENQAPVLVLATIAVVTMAAFRDSILPLFIMLSLSVPRILGLASNMSAMTSSLSGLPSIGTFLAIYAACGYAYMIIVFRGNLSPKDA